MTKQDSNKTTIKYKGKEYEIEKKKEEQRVKPKGEVSIASTGDKNEIIVKNYNEGFWTHSCECNGERIDIKWGKGRHITIWGGSSTLLASGLAIWYFGFWTKKKRMQENKDR